MMPASKIMLLSALAMATAAPAAVPASMLVVISNFKFTPSVIEMRAGTPVVLSLRNQAGSGHSFKAAELFASAHLDPKSAAYVRNGEVEIPGHSEVDVALTPAAGSYKFKCTHAFHAMLGMTGTINVR
jgi:uncharacterized cupredoxin-like copper-binding protein